MELPIRCWLVCLSLAKLLLPFQKPAAYYLPHSQAVLLLRVVLLVEATTCFQLTVSIPTFPVKLNLLYAVTSVYQYFHMFTGSVRLEILLETFPIDN